MTLLATLDRLWEPKWDPIRHYQTVSLRTLVNKGGDAAQRRAPRPGRAEPSVLRPAQTAPQPLKYASIRSQIRLSRVALGPPPRHQQATDRRGVVSLVVFGSHRRRGGDRGRLHRCPRPTCRPLLTVSRA